jgi:uncharacterized protein RhaS with RHS repeats
MTCEAGVRLGKSRFGYGSALGEGISRDPIEERGGINLYGYVGNNSINAIDLFGEAPGAPGFNDPNYDPSWPPKLNSSDCSQLSDLRDNFQDTINQLTLQIDANPTSPMVPNWENVRARLQNRIDSINDKCGKKKKCPQQNPTPTPAPTPGGNPFTPIPVAPPWWEPLIDGVDAV